MHRIRVNVYLHPIKHRETHRKAILLGKYAPDLLIKTVKLALFPTPILPILKADSFLAFAPLPQGELIFSPLT